MTATGETEIDPSIVACGAFEPIRWSRHDTPETIRQARGHNAAYDAVCGAKE